MKVAAAERALLAWIEADPARRAKELDFAFLAPFWAGLDTLGSSFVFLVQQLVLDRSLLERVRSELDDAIRKEGLSGIPSPETLRKLPLLYSPRATRACSLFNMRAATAANVCCSGTTLFGEVVCESSGFRYVLVCAPEYAPAISCS